ncbi:MAG TPA: TadE/TadG family type IV pilus assembly protein [Mycobacteriales bacterium]|nr:TadE/TadG family type IV pilus assembly protein [Mycobacteriales bacterium]
MARPRDDVGSAPVEFVLVGSLVIFLFLGILQLGLLLHMRNVVVSSASEAARTAANADRTCADARDRFRRLVHDSLSTRVSDGIRTPIACGPDGDPASGAALVRIDVDVDLPLVFLPFGSVSVSATGRAIKEGQ